MIGTKGCNARGPTSRGATFRRHAIHFVLALALGLGCRGQSAPGPDPELATNLEREIGVVEDMRVFTLFALLNVAGYDAENREAGMHPVRVQVREALGSRVDPALRAAVRDFYALHADSTETWSYSVVAMATTGPPAFDPSPAWTQELEGVPQFGALAALHGLLRRFYAEANIQSLYEGVRPAYQEYIQLYREAILRETATALEYCRLKVPALTASGERENPLVVPNLLDSYEHAFSFILDDHFTSIEGPQQRIGYNPHEFIHAATNPAVYSKATKAKAGDLTQLFVVASRELGDEAACESVEAFVDECLVRAISLRYKVPKNPEHEAKLRGAMLAEYRQGFILERFFWEQLEEYEKANVDIRGYYPRMLRRLEPAAELERWQLSPND